MFQLTGDVEGFWFWSGDLHANLKTGGDGPASGTVVFDLTSPWTAAFECRSSVMVEDYPAGLFKIAGRAMSCDGTGDLAGKQLKADWLNTPGTITYHITGVIW